MRGRTPVISVVVVDIFSSGEVIVKRRDNTFVVVSSLTDTLTAVLISDRARATVRPDRAGNVIDVGRVDNGRPQLVFYLIAVVVVGFAALYVFVPPWVIDEHERPSAGAKTALFCRAPSR